jgi:protein-S-isoprenylcysteine O-methyltransferase Ste14
MTDPRAVTPKVSGLSAARAVPLALALERYGLSAFFLYLARGEGLQVHRVLMALRAEGTTDGLFLELVRHTLVLSLNLLVGLLLLLGRRPEVPPQTWKEVLVPLGANFFYLAYNLTAWLPAPLTINLWPEAWRQALAWMAFVHGLSGFAFALWAAAALGRSFAVLVEVKSVVTTGPYRYVRHPIYLSYLLQAVGLVLAYGSVAFLTLVAGHVSILVYRARLEEARLSAASALYRAYRERTPFLLPGRPRTA